MEGIQHWGCLQKKLDFCGWVLLIPFYSTKQIALPLLRCKGGKASADKDNIKSSLGAMHCILCWTMSIRRPDLVKGKTHFPSVMQCLLLARLRLPFLVSISPVYSPTPFSFSLSSRHHTWIGFYWHFYALGKEVTCSNSLVTNVHWNTNFIYTHKKHPEGSD